MLDKLSKEDFESLIGQELQVSLGDVSVALEVKEVKPIRNPTPRAIPPFALTLRSRANWHGPQGIYRVTHPELGPLELFMVPSGPDGSGLCYEIILN